MAAVARWRNAEIPWDAVTASGRKRKKVLVASKAVVDVVARAAQLPFADGGERPVAA